MVFVCCEMYDRLCLIHRTEVGNTPFDFFSINYDSIVNLDTDNADRKGTLL